MTNEHSLAKYGPDLWERLQHFQKCFKYYQEKDVVFKRYIYIGLGCYCKQDTNYICDYCNRFKKPFVHCNRCGKCPALLDMLCTERAIEIPEMSPLKLMNDAWNDNDRDRFDAHRQLLVEWIKEHPIEEIKYVKRENISE